MEFITVMGGILGGNGSIVGSVGLLRLGQLYSDSLYFVSRYQSAYEEELVVRTLIS